MSHAMNILERLDKVRLKREGTISSMEKNTADVRELMEKYRKRSKGATLCLSWSRRRT